MRWKAILLMANWKQSAYLISPIRWRDHILKKLTTSRLQHWTSNTQHQIKHVIQESCLAYGLRMGPVHAEVRVHDANKFGYLKLLQDQSVVIAGDCLNWLQIQVLKRQFYVAAWESNRRRFILIVRLAFS